MKFTRRALGLLAYGGLLTQESAASGAVAGDVKGDGGGGMTKPNFEELDRLHEKATPGPWRERIRDEEHAGFDGLPIRYFRDENGEVDTCISAADARLIVQLRNAYPAIQEAYREQGKALERLKDLVRYTRHFLHDEGLISDKEYFALVADSDNGTRVARLETYDQQQERIKQLEADLRWLLKHVDHIEGDLRREEIERRLEGK